MNRFGIPRLLLLLSPLLLPGMADLYEKTTLPDMQFPFLIPDVQSNFHGIFFLPVYCEQNLVALVLPWVGLSLT